METYQGYEGYGISYTSMTGTTTIDRFGFTIKTFPNVGEQKGLELAKAFIDVIKNWPLLE